MMEQWSRKFFECDNIKDNWARNNGFTLVRIPYNKNVTKDYVNKLIP